MTLHVVTIEAHKEFYCIMYYEKSDALKQLGKWATNTELKFNWLDAAQAAYNLIHEEQELRVE